MFTLIIANNAARCGSNADISGVLPGTGRTPEQFNKGVYNKWNLYLMV